MDSNLLHYFLRVAELGSINKAAADLSLSQPALSRHIAALEHEMGGELFTRTHGGVVLTEAGKVLADRARPLLRQFSLIKEQVGEKAAGHLAIGIPQAWQHVFTSPFVCALSQLYPHVSLRVFEGVSNVLRDYMSAGLLDLCIMPFDPTPTGGYQQTALVRDTLIVTGAREQGLTPDTPLTFNDLDAHRLIIPGRSNPLRQYVEHSLTRRGLRFRLAVETDTLNLCLEFARKGLGLTVLPGCAVQPQWIGEDMGWAPLKGSYITWALYENQTRSHSEALREGRRLITTTLAESLSNGRWYGAEPADLSLRGPEI
ncbi:LysR family transcriptional regulator [Pusillimonas sp. NJUB218]|uniref:LysR family transcriptional regulator n=1 Tax=Pusillimonas sp. NJUB218 TaxID=2023230 RepID=UPI000F4B74A4|nr:LysR family transcriptional regulator [Pusillimonas sp. NJUB218]ROT44101.1 LysR family transcriptional regulator [Pusillimonas sp. NJUB218]